MYQVASSYQPQQYSYRDANASLPPAAVISTVQLPRTLSRPNYVEVTSSAIVAAAPEHRELANVPPVYIRQDLYNQAPAMLSGLSCVADALAKASSSRLHSEMSLPLRTPKSSAAPVYPTHVLAVSSSKPSSKEAPILFAVHGLTLASHCAMLPPLPPSRARVSSRRALEAVPVLPVTVPSPQAFRLLHPYMYSHSIHQFLVSLMPFRPEFLNTVSHDSIKSALSSGSTLHKLSNFLCDTAAGNLQTLMSHAAHIKDVWQDMAALGLYDPELWDAIDLCWEVILGALNLAASR